MRTAFSAFVFGNYERFIPFYVYSIHKIYPESDIVIFYHGQMTKTILKYLEGYSKVIIYNNFYADKAHFKSYNIRNGGGLKLLRYLIPEDYFKDYDYVYFGDVDIMILQEKKSLFEFHLEQAQQSKLPFSNKVRLLPEGKVSKRLTGLHWIHVKPYFLKITPVIHQVLEDALFRENFLRGIHRDEEFLYKLNKTAFNFNAKLLSQNLRPWHGFHLGLVRGKSFLNKQVITENSSIGVESLKFQLQEYNQGGAINNLLLKFNCIEVYNTYKYFDIMLPLHVRLKYEYIIIKTRLTKDLKNIKSNLFNG